MITSRQAMLIGLGAVLVAVLPFSLLATNDGPRHLLTGAVHFNPEAYPCFEPNWPTTSAHMPELFAPFLLFLSPLAAGEVVGRLVPLFVALAAMVLVRTRGGSASSLIVAPLAALSQAVALGFVPFQMGLIAGFLAIAATSARRPALAVAGTALLLWLSARLHLYAGAAAGVLAAVSLVARFGWSRGLLASVGCAIAPLSVALLSADSALKALNITGSSVLSMSAAKLVSASHWGEHLEQAARFLVPLPPAAGLCLGTGLLAAYAWALLRRPSPVIVVGALFGLGSLLMPTDLSGWQYGGLRLLPFVVVVGACALPARIAPACAVLMFAVAVGFGIGARQASAALKPYLADVERLQAPPRVELEVMLGASRRGFFEGSEPVFSLGQLISLRFGNMSMIGQHAVPFIHGVFERCSRDTLPMTTKLAPIALLDASPRPLADVKTWSSHADGVVLVVVDPNLVESVESELGFEPQQLLPHLRIGTQRHCPLQVTLVDAVVGLDVLVGFEHAGEPARSYVTDQAGSLSMDVPLPCGKRMLQVKGPDGRCAEGEKVVENDGSLICHWQQTRSPSSLPAVHPHP
jgi:hypothetical protein